MKLRAKPFAFLAVFWLALDQLWAGDPGPTQGTSPDGNGYHGAIPVNDPFPDNYYGADHGGSGLSLNFPFTSRFGATDHSRGQFVYKCAPFSPRGSEGVFGMDVWLEEQNSDGSWSPVGSGGYQPINTPNPGPSSSFTFTWNYDASQLPANTNFRVFVYVYLYNQGGGSQGDFPVYSTTDSVNTGAANDAPRINWTAPGGSTNPDQVIAGQSYVISAAAEDDNGNLSFVGINKNGQPFAYAGGGDGYGGNSQNPTSDGIGIQTYTAWAVDSAGAQSPPINWTINVVGKSDQAGVASSNVSIPFYSQPFTPSYSGGSGTGGWQFAVGGQTNWTANDMNIGTQLPPTNNWSPSWMPPAPGSYAFWVAKDGDGNYNESAIAGPYTLTVTPGAPVGSFDGLSAGSVVVGQSIGGSGWAADAQSGSALSSVQILVDGGTAGSFAASLGANRPDVQAANNSARWSPRDLSNSGWTFAFNTSGLSIGGHSFTAVAYDNGYGVSTSLGTRNFSVSSLGAQSVAISPTTVTVNPGQAVTFTASGGNNGYLWGGSANGAGSTQTVSFPSVGSYAVSVYSPAGGVYAQSNTAAAAINVLPAGQTVSLAPANPTVSAGANITFTAGGGQNGYIWGGAASGNGSTQTVHFSNVGNYSVTAYSPAGGNYSQSNLASAGVTVTPNGQAVSLTPANPAIGAGGTITFIAAGGQNGYVWGGAASGSGPSQSVTFATPGNYPVTVLSTAGGNFSQSNLASTTVTVTPNVQTVTLSPANPAITAGGSVGFAAAGGQNGYVWGGAASGAGAAQTVNFPNVGTFPLTVYSPAGGQFGQSNLAGTTVTVNPAAQTVALGPVNPFVPAGASVSFTATGGQNGYVWGGAATGTGAVQTVAFPNTGTYPVSVFSPGAGNFAPSNLATTTVTVVSGQQDVSIFPINPEIPAGNSIFFGASGGQNGYVWGGMASGGGAAHTVYFPNAGIYPVTVFSPDGNGYAASPIAASFVTVDPIPQMVWLGPTDLSVNAGDSVSFFAGGGLNGYVWGGAASGGGAVQSVTFPNVGQYWVSVFSPGGGNFLPSNLAFATVNVNPVVQTVWLWPQYPTIEVGGSIGFSASGGQNGYVWGGSASGGGGSQLVNFPNVGSYAITVFSPGGGSFAPSNLVGTTVQVLPAGQVVTITPSAPVVNAGQALVFSAAGGMNGYIWGAPASGSGPSQSVLFPNPGVFGLTVFSPAGGNFAQSNFAVAMVTVNALPPASSAQIQIRAHGGEVKVQNRANQHNSQILIPEP